MADNLEQCPMSSVSVLIPAFNASSFILDTLNSCIAQGDSIKEIIVVDDGSTDNTVETVDALRQSNAAPIHLIRTENHGACHARNLAFSHAKADWIQWLDCDDILAEGKIQRQLEWLSSKPDSLAYSGWEKFRGKPATSSFSQWDTLHDEYSPTEWLKSRTMGIPGCWLGHRSLFESIGPWDESLFINQDGEYFTRAIVKAQSVGVIKNTGVHYRVGHANRTSNFSPDKAKSLYQSIESFENEALKLGSDLNHVIAEQYQAFIHRVYPHCRAERRVAGERIKALADGPIENHLLESERSKQWAALIGWKAFVLLRRWSWTFRKK